MRGEFRAADGILVFTLTGWRACKAGDLFSLSWALLPTARLAKWESVFFNGTFGLILVYC